MQIQIVNKSDNPNPTYQTKFSAGMDLMSYLEEPIIIKSGEFKLISTGIHIKLPESVEAQVRPRSGLALKKGISVLNSPGTIDSDYRGEIGVILINHSNEEFVGSLRVFKSGFGEFLRLSDGQQITIEDLESVNRAIRVSLARYRCLS